MRQITTLAFMLLITGLLFGCGGGSSSTSASKPVSMAVFVTGKVVDAGTSTGIAATITVSGLSSIYDFSGSQLPMTVATASDGTYKFALKQMPATDTTITISAKTTNYIANSQTLTVTTTTQQGAFFTVNVPLTSMTGSTPAGVFRNMTTGTTATPLTVSATDSATKTATKITIPQGATALAGATPLSGPLTVTATNYSLAVDSTALGLTPSDGKSFISSAITDFSVTDQSGKVATKLSTPMTITMNIADGTINETTCYDNAGNYVPANCRAYQDQDPITVYTYSTSLGQWIPEPSLNNGTGTATVKQDAPGGPLYVSFPADHFSYWNLGSKLFVTYCPTKKVISMTGPGSTLALSLKVTKPANVYANGLKPANDVSVTVDNVPKNTALTYQAFYGPNNILVGTLNSQAANACKNETMTVELPHNQFIYNWTVDRQCQWDYPAGSLNYLTQGLPNATLYDCPPGTLVVGPSCVVVGATNASGFSTFMALPSNSLIIVPSDAFAYLGRKQVTLPTGTSPITGVTHYVGNWEFCPNTGLTNQGTPLPL